MIKQFTFRGMEHSATIEEFAREQFDKLIVFSSMKKNLSISI